MIFFPINQVRIMYICLKKKKNLDPHHTPCETKLKKNSRPKIKV